jgi:hypothetical protein
MYEVVVIVAVKICSRKASAAKKRLVAGIQ